MSAVSRKHQVTIPSEVMRTAGLQAGDDVSIRAVGPGRVEMVKTDDLIEEFAGSLDKSTFPPGYLDEVREWG
ncbi:MAG: AbrB/MazE/SpoVT family DNA-binding domain-containing protein [Solirubrobacteraceae bacterium]